MTEREDHHRHHANGRQADVEEPLLDDEAFRRRRANDGASSSDPLSSASALLARLALLLRTARAWRGALCLALLSVVESYVISRSGAVAGSFYKVLVDGAQARAAGGEGEGGEGGATPPPATALRAAFCAALLWYGLSALLASAKSALADGLAWAWRARLSAEMQRLYLRGAAHYRLSRAPATTGDDEAAQKKRRGEGAPRPSSSSSSPSSSPLLSLDSPDQRIAQDLPGLTRALADSAAVLVAAPFGLCWYGRLVFTAFGGSLWPLFAALLFFLLGCCAQRPLVRRVARLVVALEAAEGAYRFSHSRLRGAEAEGVALYSSSSCCFVSPSSSSLSGEGERRQQQQQQQRKQRQRQGQRKQAAPAELASLQGKLDAVLAAEGRLVPARWMLAAATRLIDYGGAVLNYACVAAAVFGAAGAALAPPGGSGGGGEGEGRGGGGGSNGDGGFFSSSSPSSSSSSPGDVAQRVSVASFYLLTLIYSFTQVLDLSRTLSDAAGLAARVGALHEALLLAEEEEEEEPEGGDDGEQGGSEAAAAPLLLELRSVRLSTAGSNGGALVVSGLCAAVSTAPRRQGEADKEPPSSLLVVGPSGVGKTTLVRAIAGLAPLDQGEVLLLGGGAEGSGVFFVPQRPLAAPGATLRLQLTYPHGPCACSLRAEEEDEARRSSSGGGKRGALLLRLALGLLGLGWRQEQEEEMKADAFSPSPSCSVCGGDARLLGLLEEVGLANLAARLGLCSLDAPLRLLPQRRPATLSGAASSSSPAVVLSSPDWASVLSPGELQRLAFARLLRAAPRLAVLDEPVASLPPAEARRLYSALAKRNVAWVSCGHEGGGMEALHEATLRILGDGSGGWTIERN